MNQQFALLNTAPHDIAQGKPSTYLVPITGRVTIVENDWLAEKFPGETFIVHRDPSHPDYWNVTLMDTGCFIGKGGRTSKAAVDLAVNRLEHLLRSKSMETILEHFNTARARYAEVSV